MNTDKAMAITAKGSLQMIPFAGGFLSEIYTEFVCPLAKRREKFLISISEELEKLKDKNGNAIILNDFKDNEAFISILGSALNKVAFTSAEEKIKSYKAIILNSVRNKLENEEKVKIFIELIDKFSVYHLHALRGIKKGTGVGHDFMSFPPNELKDKLSHGLWIKIAQDLELNGFFDLNYMIKDRRNPNSIEKNMFLSDFGNEFKQFIELPIINM